MLNLGSSVKFADDLNLVQPAWYPHLYLTAPGEWPDFEKEPDLYIIKHRKVSATKEDRLIDINVRVLYSVQPSLSRFQIYFDVDSEVVVNLNKSSPCISRQELVCNLERGGRRCRNFTYNVPLCKALALQKELIKMCRCIIYKYPMPQSAIDLPNCFYMPKEAYLNRGYTNVSTNGSFHLEVQLLNRTSIPAELVSNFRSMADRYNCFKRWQSRIQFIKDNANCIRVCSTSKYTISNKMMVYYEPFNPNIFLGVKVGMLPLYREMQPILQWYKSVNKSPLPDRLEKRYMESLARAKRFALHYERLNEIPRFMKYFYGHLSLIQMKQKTLKCPGKFETLRYQLQTLMADMGGTLGIWLGASVLMVFELIESFIGFICKRRKKN